MEQTVAGNARLEQELLVLRQKLQFSKSASNGGGVSGTEGSYANNTTAMLESELRRVQSLVGDMQRQRQELSSAVRQLTENSNRLYQEIGNKEQTMNSVAAAECSSGNMLNGEKLSLAGNSLGNGSNLHKRTSSGCWTETDLDSMLAYNHTTDDYSTVNSLATPLYVETNGIGSMLNAVNGGGSNGTFLTNKILNDYQQQTNEILSNEINRKLTVASRYGDSYEQLEETLNGGVVTNGRLESDVFLETNPFANFTNTEKPEIKTVRIVKRESERRHRDRTERNGLTNSMQNLDQVLEEEQFQVQQPQQQHHHNSYDVGSGGASNRSSYVDERSKSLPRTYNEPLKTSRHSSLMHRAQKQNSAYADSLYGAMNGTKFNNNQGFSLVNGGSASGDGREYSSQGPKEYLNPLANAYFAKQLQQQQQQNHDQHRSHHYAQHQLNYSYVSSNGLDSKFESVSNLSHKTDSVQSLNKSLTDLTPAFQSEAAKQILNEMSAGSASEDTEKVIDRVPAQHKYRRAVPREKRRHYTAPNNVLNPTEVDPNQCENNMNHNVCIN